MTIKNIEDRARTLLLDTYGESCRYAPKEMFYALREGVRTLNKLRPETRYVNGLLEERALTDLSYNKRLPFFVFEAEPTQVDGVNYSLDTYRNLTLNLSERYEDALVNYVVYAMYLKDDADTANAQLASAYYQRFVASANT